MAFSSNGTSNGTITAGNIELKADSASSNLIPGSVPMSQTISPANLLDSSMSGKKNRHDDEEQGKLFVGGLSWDTAQDSLLQYFSRFGEVIDCVVMKNAETGRSRGFGFVTFSDPANVEAVIASCPHTLDGRTIDPKSCNPRSMQKPKRSNYLPKIFLGGLPSSITETDLRSFFTKYGEVCEVVIMYDQEKKKSRGFGFLSFADESACSKAVAEHFVNIQSKQVEIKRAEPRTIQATSNNLGKEVISNTSPQSQCQSIPNGHSRHLPTSYGGFNVPPSPGAANHSSVSVQPHPQSVHGWAVSPQTAPPPIHGNNISTMPPTGAHISHIIPPQTPPHPPPTGFPTHYTSPATTPHVQSPVTPNWLHPPPIPASRAATTPQPFMAPNNWVSTQLSSQPNKVPTFPSHIPVASPINPPAQTSPFPGAASVYPPPSTPQPNFWGMVPVPTPPPASQATAVVPFGAPPPPPIATSHAQLQSNVVFSQYGGMTVSAAPLVATPVPPPVAYSIYPQNSITAVHPVVSSATQSPVKPYPNSSGVEFIEPSGPMSHNPINPGAIGGMLVASPTSATQISHQPVVAASGVATIPTSTDINNPIAGNLGPQRGVIYNPPSQIQGYHPYRRM